jgi:SSS family solute:Na+ symporter
MFGLPLVDILVIGVYFLIAIAIGYAAMRLVKGQEDYFLAGRGFGKVIAIFASFGQATSSESAVGTATTTYRDGAAGIWSQLGNLWSTPIFWITSPWYRRMRVYSMGEFFFDRYQSRKLSIVYAAIASFLLVLIVAIGLKALTFTIQGMTLKDEASLTVAEREELMQAQRLHELNTRVASTSLAPEEAAELTRLRIENPRREFSHLSQGVMVWTVIGIVFIYGLAGGLRGAVWTDVFQGCLIMCLSVMLFPFAYAKLATLYETGSFLETMSALHDRLPAHFFAIMGGAQSTQFAWYFILALSVMGTINVAVQANQLTSNAPAKDELTASIGFVSGVLLKRYLTLAWGLLAILCFALYNTQITNPDLVWGHATRDLLGPVGFGLVGLMIACLFAALQSTASTLMISASTMLTRDVYLPLFPGRSEAHYVLIGRIAGAVFLVAAGFVCVSFDTMLSLMKYLWEFNAVIAASFWCGVKWRGATRTGAWTSILVSLLLFTVIPAVLPVFAPSLRFADSTLRQTESRVVQVEYRATRYDVLERAELIAGWSGSAPVPAPLIEGERFSRAAVVAPRAIFWSGGIGLRDGRPAGEGMFFPDLFILGQIFDLERNTYALNETIRYWVKILLPFILLIGVSLLFPREPEPEVKRFFLRMRTKVRADRTEDDAALARAYADPASTSSVLLFPHTRFEFQKLERTDIYGLAAGFAGVLLLLALFYGALSIGA